MLKILTTAGTALVLLAGAAFAQGGGFTETKDIPFSTDPPLLLDTYVPDTVDEATPVLVFFYGGGWSDGSRNDIRWIGRELAQSGIIVVAPSYRHYPDAVFPAIAEDVAASVAWAWRELRRPDGTPRALFVGGVSAGAYNAALIAFDQEYLAAEGVPQDGVSGMIGLAGPYMGLPEHEPLKFPEDPPDAWDIATHADPQDPPMLLIHGDQDRVIPWSEVNVFAAEARAAGAKVTTLILANRFHDTMKLDVPGSETRAIVEAFIAAHPRR